MSLALPPTTKHRTQYGRLIIFGTLTWCPTGTPGWSQGFVKVVRGVQPGDRHVRSSS